MSTRPVSALTPRSLPPLTGVTLRVNIQILHRPLSLMELVPPDPVTQEPTWVVNEKHYQWGQGLVSTSCLIHTNEISPGSCTLVNI